MDTVEHETVFGPGRPAAAMQAINELAAAREAASKVCWTNERAQKRLRNAETVRKCYPEYGDSFRGH